MVGRQWDEESVMELSQERKMCGERRWHLP